MRLPSIPIALLVRLSVAWWEHRGGEDNVASAFRRKISDNRANVYED
jgi:hypothetical protein